MAYFRCGNGSGVTPTSITPSDSSPAALTANTPVTPSANGYAIASNPTAITPSSSGTSVSNGDMIRIGGAGYVIRPDIIFPDDANPAILTNGKILKIIGSGYAYNSKQPNFMSPDKTQLISSSTGGTTNISVTQKPRYIVMATWNAAGTTYGGMLGVVDVANETAKRLGYSSSAISWSDWSGYTNYFTSITSSTVTYKSNWSTNTATRSMILIYY